MASRVTIVLSSSNSEKLRNLQAKMIKTSSKSVSFSHVLNSVLEEGLKKYKVWFKIKVLIEITIWLELTQQNVLLITVTKKIQGFGR